MIRITVAIPVYNAAKHIDVLFDSLMRQTMNREYFEVICVNDCSTDNSKEVIEKYSQMLGNVVLIDRVENSGGPVVPRNDAINAARGEYIHFVDNDDFLGEEALERLYQAAHENQSDVIFGRYIGVNGRGIPYATFKHGNRPKADLITDDLIYAIAPHKMFRLAFLREHGIKFDLYATAGNDDQLFVMQCYIAARVITVLADYPYYFIVARGDENLSSNYVPAADWLYVWHRIIEYMNECIHDEQYKRKIKITILNRLPLGTRFETFLLTSKTTREQKIEWLNEANRFVDLYIDDSMIESVEPRFRLFWRAIKQNDIDALVKMSSESNSNKIRHTRSQVKIKQANTVSYKRPSVNAIPATTFTKAGEVITVYPTIKGWFEIRRIEKDGTHFAEFIQMKDVRYTSSYLMLIILNKIKALRWRMFRIMRSFKK